MKMKIICMLIISLLFLSSCTHNPSSNKERDINNIILFSNTEIKLPPKLANIKLGLKVENEPKNIYAADYEKDTTYFVWKMQTTVQAIYDDVKIIEFGDYKLNDDGTWSLHTQTGHPFTEKDFNNWYLKKENGYITWENCKNGTVTKGDKYVDMNNWTAKEKEMLAQKGIWYFIGTNSSGEEVLGYDNYENIPEYLKNKEE